MADIQEIPLDIPLDIPDNTDIAEDIPEDVAVEVPEKPIKAKDFLNPEHIKTDNSKVNENLLKENEELKDKLCDIAKDLESSVTGSIYTKYLLNKFFKKSYERVFISTNIYMYGYRCFS